VEIVPDIGGGEFSGVCFVGAVGKVDALSGNGDRSARQLGESNQSLFHSLGGLDDIAVEGFLVLFSVSFAGLFELRGTL